MERPQNFKTTVPKAYHKQFRTKFPGGMNHSLQGLLCRKVGISDPTGKGPFVVTDIVQPIGYRWFLRGLQQVGYYADNTEFIPWTCRQFATSDRTPFAVTYYFHPQVQEGLQAACTAWGGTMRELISETLEDYLLYPALWDCKAAFWKSRYDTACAKHPVVAGNVWAEMRKKLATALIPNPYVNRRKEITCLLA